MRNITQLFLSKKYVFIIAVFSFLLVSITGFGQVSERTANVRSLSQTSASKKNNSNITAEQARKREQEKQASKNPVRLDTESKPTNNEKVDYSLLDFKANEIYSPFKPQNELTEKRQQYAKHFANEDGSVSAILTAGGSLNYLDENLRWKSIDRQIEINSSGRHPQHGFANMKNAFSSFYGSDASQGVITEYKEGNVIEGLNKKMLWLDSNYNPISAYLIAANGAEVSENKIVYPNVISGVDLIYYQQNDGRKMDYVINNITNAPSGARYLAFAEDFKLPNGSTLNEEKNEEGNTIIINVVLDGKILFRYDLPKHNDSNGKEITSYYKVSQNTIYTIVEKEWLDSGLVFPVTIDPTVTVYPTASGNFNTGVIDASSNITRNNDIYVGMRNAYGLTTGTRRFFRGYMSFNMSSIPAGSIIDNTVFGCYIGLNTLYSPDGQYARVVPITSGIPNTATGATLYNMCNENVASQLFSINPGATGNASLNISTVVNTFVQNSLTAGIFSLGIAPVGNYSTSYTEQVGVYGSNRPQATSNGRPYLTIIYTAPPSNYNLTVSEAYTGGSPANGSTTYSANASVTATSGTRTGYTLSGWSGTGSVPATGTTGSVTFTIAANSTITWNWVLATATGAPTFYNIGGSEQLAFNNSRLNDDTPTFRLSHTLNPANRYQIQVSADPSFSGTPLSQTFTGTYPVATQANYNFTASAGQLTNGTTYYVRARTSGDAGALWSNWTTETYSFTYEDTTIIPNWFQTTQAQLATATTSGVTANASGALELTSTGGDVIVNGSFENTLTGWAINRAGTWYTGATNIYGVTQGTKALEMYNNNPGSFGYFVNDYVSAYQTVNLTGVSNLTMDVGYEAEGPFIVQFRVYVAETTEAAGTLGTLVHTWTPTSNLQNTSLNINLNSYAFTGNKIVKLVYYVIGQEVTYNERYIYVDNVKAIVAPNGTATSTALQLASIQGAVKYNTLQWSQTLNGGNVSMKIQQYNGSTWADVAGYTNITGAGDGLKSFNLGSMTAYPQIRAVAALSGNTNAVFVQDWSITVVPPCAAEITTITTASTVCPNDTVNLTAVANDSNHTIRWYSSATGETILGTGTTFTTPALTATTTFYAAAYNGTCESTRQSVVITVTPIVSALNKTIGAPANGTSHNIALSWNAVAGISNYAIEYSEDNSTWLAATTTAGTSYTFNAGDHPDKVYYFRIKSQSGNCYTESGPIYTAADNPTALTLNNPTGSSMQINIAAETPVANPAHTTYAIMGEASGLYVQANGALGVTAVYRTKADWGTVTVTGLTPETQYCFIAKAKNQDGDIRFSQPANILAVQEFNSNVLTTSTATTGWYAPNSNQQFTWTATGGCTGGKIGYNATFNNFWGNFVRIPRQNMTGLNKFVLKFDMSNSYTAGRVNSNIYFSVWADEGYRSIISEVKVNGVVIPLTSNGAIKFDALRTCVPVEVTFDLDLATYNVINHGSIDVYLNASSAYNNSDPFNFVIDNVALVQGGSVPTAACLSTGLACDAAITAITNGSGCGEILLQATGSASTTAFNWYDAASNGTLLATTAIGEWTSPAITATTTYYVSASNGTCESARIAVTATKTETTAIILSTNGASLCGAGSITLYAETNNDDAYVVNWYSSETGGTILHTGFSYTVSPNTTTTYYVAAAEGQCESVREPVTATISSKIWNGSVDTNWNNPENWTPNGAPTLDNCVVVPQVANLPIVNGNNAYAKTLTVENNATLLIKSNNTITVANEVTVGQTAHFTVENDASLVQTQNVSENQNSGKITVNRNSTSMFRLEATGWASPVENQKIYDFALGTVFGRVYFYDEAANAFSNVGITANTEFVKGQGYSVRSPNAFPGYSPTATPVIFNGTFFGKPNNGDIGVSVTKTNLGFNYVGNPYPSPIDAELFLGENLNIEALYFWTHEAPPIDGLYAANNYASYTRAGGTDAAAGGEEPNGIIQTGQGFIVKALQSYLVQFTNDMRVGANTGQFFRSAETVERHRIWLNLSDATTNLNQILVGYMSNATMAADHQIDAKLFGYTGSAIYSLIDAEKYVIQGRSLPFTATDVVPLGFKAASAGVFKISIDHVDGLFLEGQNILIRDLLNNTVHNLSNGEFTFTSAQGTFNSRFEIIYQNALSNSDPISLQNDWFAVKGENTVTVKSIGFDIENIEIFDLTGRLLFRKNGLNTQEFVCPVQFADQMLLVKINHALTKKVL